MDTNGNKLQSNTSLVSSSSINRGSKKRKKYNNNQDNDTEKNQHNKSSNNNRYNNQSTINRRAITPTVACDESSNSNNNDSCIVSNQIAPRAQPCVAPRGATPQFVIHCQRNQDTPLKGMRVASYRRMCSGDIANVRQSGVGTYDIDVKFDNGDSGTFVYPFHPDSGMFLFPSRDATQHDSALSPSELDSFAKCGSPQCGMRVEGKFDSVWYKGTITSVHEDDSDIDHIHVVYDDGDERDEEYPCNDIRLLGGGRDVDTADSPLAASR